MSLLIEMMKKGIYSKIEVVSPIILKKKFLDVLQTEQYIQIFVINPVDGDQVKNLMESVLSA